MMTAVSNDGRRDGGRRDGGRREGARRTNWEKKCRYLSHSMFALDILVIPYKIVIRVTT